MPKGTRLGTDFGWILVRFGAHVGTNQMLATNCSIAGALIAFQQAFVRVRPPDQIKQHVMFQLLLPVSQSAAGKFG